VVLLLAAALLLYPEPARAQCGEPPPSSCSSCHVLEHPINMESEWHLIHCRQDICLSCHGGNASTMDMDLSHESMNAQPLSDIYTDCHSCHPDYDERAGRFTTALGVTPGSCATPTLVAPNSSHLVPPFGSADPASPQADAPLTLASAALMAGGLTAMALFLLAIRWLDRHRTDTR
jgi:hypothetical protein